LSLGKRIFEPLIGGIGEGKVRSYFFEKKAPRPGVTKELLLRPAFERPNCGRSKAGGNISFLGAFF
jgi:hypothetical protein